MPNNLTRLTFIAAAFSAAVPTVSTAAETPYISSYAPTSGAPGSVITVNGSGFTGVNGATIGNAHDSTVMVMSDKLLKVIVPTDATTGKLAIHNGSAWSWSANNFTVSKSSSTATTTSVSTTSTTSSSTATSTGGYTLAGVVSGASGIPLQLTGATTKSATTNSSGAFSFAGIANGEYTLAPNRAGYTYTPTSIAESVKGKAVSGIDFVAHATTAATMYITGNVSGVAASGVTVTLNGANTGSAATDSAGNFGFFNLAKGTYTLTAYSNGVVFGKAKTVTLTTADSTGSDFTSSTAATTTSVTITAVSPLPAATVGTAYSAVAFKAVAGGTAPYHYETGTAATGTPPPGLLLNTAGTLIGTPTTAGSYKFQVCATDSKGAESPSCSATSIVVAAAAATTSSGSSATTGTVSSGTSWVYYNGTFDWPGDFSFVAKPNYADTSGAPLSGTKDIEVTLTGAYGGWLPYSLGWDFNSKPYTKLTFSLKPTVANQRWSVFFVKVGDVPVGISLDPTKYGPAPVVGKWATYTIPMADLGVLGASIYKFGIQDQTGLSSNHWYVDNVGFVP